MLSGRGGRGSDGSEDWKLVRCVSRSPWAAFFTYHHVVNNDQNGVIVRALLSATTTIPRPNDACVRFRPCSQVQRHVLQYRQITVASSDLHGAFERFGKKSKIMCIRHVTVCDERLRPCLCHSQPLLGRRLAWVGSAICQSGPLAVSLP
jgi:hypothetical protein